MYCQFKIIEDIIEDIMEDYQVTDTDTHKMDPLDRAQILLQEDPELYQAVLDHNKNLRTKSWLENLKQAIHILRSSK